MGKVAVVGCVAGVGALLLRARYGRQDVDSQDPLVCCGDIGGTNARMQMWRVSCGEEADKLVLDRRYASRDFDGLEPLLRQFMLDCGLPTGESPYNGEMVEACCVAICGAVAGESKQCGEYVQLLNVKLCP